MKQENITKIRVVKLLELLRQESDEDHYLGTNEIIARLGTMNIGCDRRRVYADVALLNEYGYEILCEKVPGKANRYCIADRSFDVPELRILMDAVQASSFITPRKTHELVDKIAYLGGSHRAELLQSNVVEFNTTKGTNESIFYSISEITQAIEKGVKVSFEYFERDENHSKVYRKNGKRYFVNPVATIYDDNNYYLVCYYGKHEDLVHYRIDRMEHVAVVEDQPMDEYPGKSIDLKRHKKTVFGMYRGNATQVEMQADKSILNPIYDKFGEQQQVTLVDDATIRFTAEVQVSEVFFSWCCLFGNKLRITAPDHVVARMKSYVQSIAAQYADEEEQRKPPLDCGD